MGPDALTAVSVAQQVSELLRARFGRVTQIENKGEVDLVTDVDRAAEAQIVATLRSLYPEDDILAEEGTGHRGGSRRCWIIDPLDGTTNFAHGFPWFAVSIALVEEGMPKVGVITQPLLEETFVAEEGKGAWLNGEPIRVSGTDRLSEALMATGFPYDRRQSDIDNLDHFGRMQKTAFACRRAGSACLDLAYIAAGRLDGYWEMKLKPWDMAAGVLLVTEAGGTVTDFAGGVFAVDGPEVLATNGQIHEEVAALLVEGKRP